MTETSRPEGLCNCCPDDGVLRLVEIGRGTKNNVPIMSCPRCDMIKIPRSEDNP